MDPAILELIDKRDNSELIRDQIGAILLVESTKQQELAEAASKDPKLWKLRVYTERANPWQDFSFPGPEDAELGDQEHLDRRLPIVNVSVERGTYNPSASDIVERQRVTVTYNVDCYGFGVNIETAEGHTSSDQHAALESQRAYRLVRNILMSAHYTYLGLPRGTVSKRWTRDFQVFQPQLEDRPVGHSVGIRLAFEVEFNEFSPQVTGQLLELISVGVTRRETGELYFKADYEHEAEES